MIKVSFLIAALLISSIAHAIQDSLPVSEADLKIPVAITQIVKSSECKAPGERMMYFCTGTRISDHQVLTAGHCAAEVYAKDNPGAIYVWQDYKRAYQVIKDKPAGTCFKPYEIMERELSSGQALRAQLSQEDSLRNQYLNFKTTPNDAALLEVSGNLNHTIVPMALDFQATQGIELEILGLGPTECWEGHNDRGGSMMRAAPGRALFKIAPDYYLEEITKQYQKLAFFTDPGNHVLVMESMGSNKLCHGDSGSGVFLRKDSRLELVAVLSKMGDEQISGHQDLIHLSFALGLDSPFLFPMISH